MRLSLIFGSAKLNQDLSFPEGLCHRQTGEALPLPDGWRQHVDMLEEMGLPPPRNIHSLDKAVAWVTLLHEVEFDLNTSRVTCRFHNDYLATFPLPPRHARPLHAIPIAYLTAKRELVAKHAALVADACRARAPPRQPPPQKKRNKLTKPKKRDRAPSFTPCPLIPAPSTVTPPPLPTWFRRATRPVIIDIYRRLVVPHLSQAFWSRGCEYLDPQREASPPGVGPNYALWTVRSVMTQLEAKMDHGDLSPPPLVPDMSDESADGLGTPPASSSGHDALPTARDPALRTAYLHFARYIPTLERGARKDAMVDVSAAWCERRRPRTGSPLARHVRRDDLPEDQRRCLDAPVCAMPSPGFTARDRPPGERARKVALTTQEGEILEEVRRRVGVVAAKKDDDDEEEEAHVQVHVWEHDDEAVSFFPAPKLRLPPPPLPPRSPARPPPMSMGGPARHRALARVYAIEVS